MNNVEMLRTQIVEQVKHVSDADLLDLILKMLIAESEAPQAVA